MDTQKSQLIPELESYISEFQRIKLQAVHLTHPLTESQFKWTPEPGRWSVSECISHLNTLGLQLLPFIERAIEKGHQKGITGKPPFNYGPISRLFINANEPTAKRKIKTPKSYKPASVEKLEKDAVMKEFWELQVDFMDQVEKANGLDLKKIKVRSPALPLFRLSLGAWFAATVAHEKRHLAQAERVIENLPGD